MYISTTTVKQKNDGIAPIIKGGSDQYRFEYDI